MFVGLSVFPSVHVGVSLSIKHVCVYVCMYVCIGVRVCVCVCACEHLGESRCLRARVTVLEESQNEGHLLKVAIIYNSAPNY